MRVGIQLIFQNLHESLSDAEMVRGEVALGELADRSGFDFLGLPEHHFDAYSMSPDNIQTLTWLAARTTSIPLLISAAIMPWHDPLRVAEKTILLDILSEGRVLFGVGRGLARMEYEAFRQDMAEARDRYNESTAMVLQALETGVIRGEGPYYVQPEIELRPRPIASFQDRVYAVAVSQDSVESAADIGAVMMTFTQKGPEHHLPLIQHYRERFEKAQGKKPQPPVLIDFTYCNEDADVAEEVVRKHLLANYVATHHHYDMGGEHFRRTKGYENYQAQAEEVRALGLEKAAEEYINAQIWGTPGQMVDKFRKRAEALGPFASSLAISYGGMPFETATESMRLIAEEVLPAVQRI